MGWVAVGCLWVGEGRFGLFLCVWRVPARTAHSVETATIRKGQGRPGPLRSVNAWQKYLFRLGDRQWQMRLAERMKAFRKNLKKRCG